MSKSVVVEAKHITKIYKLYKKNTDRVKEVFSPFKKKYHKEFKALSNASLTLKKGEALGIIGRNGDGKSTLLKIIAGVLTPTRGSVNTKGRIAAILEVTSGLKAELTGMENIRLNLKINGYKGNEIRKRTEKVIEFAELNNFINQPVKTYSSGMKSRLGFGIVTSIEPDILLLDEVLAVGDFVFQQKCLSKIKSMRKSMSVVFVSHSMNSVRLFCDRALVLNKGSIVYDGIPDDAIKLYLEQGELKKKQRGVNQLSHKPSTPFYGNLFHNKNVVSNISHFWINNSGKRITQSHTGDDIALSISFQLSYSPKNLIVGLPIWNSKEEYISGIATDIDKVKLIPLADNRYEILFKHTNILNPETYNTVVAINDGAECLYRGCTKHLDVINNNSRFFGYVTLKHAWEGKSIKSDKTYMFDDVKLTIDSNDSGGKMYDGKSSYEELNNTLYNDIKKRFNPDAIIDIGANYGYTGIVFKKKFPNAHLTLVEPCPSLCEYIAMNIQQNKINEYEIINAICAEKPDLDRNFALNPLGSQDNRVLGENEGWKIIQATTVTLDKLLADANCEFYFIKIDTQGYEKQVFEGGLKFLSSNSNWFIKTEFAPHWLKSQGTNPLDFLQFLIENFAVAELPLRPRFIGDSIKYLFKNRLNLSDIDRFVEYLQKHNKNRRGWCDLIVMPKDGMKRYELS